MSRSRMHSLRRTSQKGQDFIGVCVLCGKEGLTLRDMSAECVNVLGLSADEALMDAIHGRQQ